MLLIAIAIKLTSKGPVLFKQPCHGENGREFEVYKFRRMILEYMRRHKVKPGITGRAQVNGHRGETDTLEKMGARVEHDLFYIRRWSLWLDVKIIFLTVFGREVRQNAY